MNTQMQPKIALIHATRLAIAPIEKTFQDFWPEANTFNLLDEGLLKDIDSLSSQQMNKRFQSLASYATDTGCDAILFSCSVFSDSIDSVKKIFDLPIYKPNEAMLDAIYQLAREKKDLKMVVMGTSQLSVDSLSSEIGEWSKTNHASIHIEKSFIDKAFELLGQGQMDLHDALIMDAVKKNQNADLIVFTQFSMASAYQRCQEISSAPIYSAPIIAVQTLQTRITHER
jgi:aspartate/glutamate racemase